MSAAASFLSSAMLRLYEAREEAGDYTLTCRGVMVKAHSLILSNSTNYFERAMATEVGEGGRLGMEVWECEIATLETVVAFMYGVEVPEGFADLQGLLELGDRFLLEELKEEAGRRIAQHIDAQNFRNICEMADLHKAKSLAVACAKFVMTKPEQEVDWAAMQQLHLVMAAVAEETRLAIRKFNQEKLRLQAFQSRGQAFDVDKQEYGQFIAANVAVGIRVCYKCLPTQRGTILEIHDDFAVVSRDPSTPRGEPFEEDKFYHDLQLV